MWKRLWGIVRDYVTSQLADIVPYATVGAVVVALVTSSLAWFANAPLFAAIAMFCVVVSAILLVANSWYGRQVPHQVETIPLMSLEGFGIESQRQLIDQFKNYAGNDANVAIQLPILNISHWLKPLFPFLNWLDGKPISQMFHLSKRSINIFKESK